MLRRCILLPAFALIAACNPSPTPAPTIALPVLVLPSLPPTPGTPPTRTSLLPSPAPTSPPVDGLTTTQLNVRLEPSTGSTAVGVLPGASAVQVIARDASGSWYRILYPQAPAGTGWVSAAYVQVPDRNAVPVIPAGENGPSAALIQQVNVRSGPGTSFTSLGTLNAGDVVALTARNSEGTWLQISFPSGPEGRGWVAAAFLQSGDASALPILGGQGEVLGTGTPTALPATPTPTLLPAIDDGDSSSAPGASLVLSPSSAGAAQFTSDLSSPSGDSDDWIRFVSTLPRIALRLDCTGTGSVSAELLMDGNSLVDWPSLDCGDRSVISIDVGQPYVLHLQVTSLAAGLVYTRYTLFITVVQ